MYTYAAYFVLPGKKRPYYIFLAYSRTHSRPQKQKKKSRLVLMADGASERRNETTRARAEAALLFSESFLLDNNRAAGRIEENTHTRART
jgi:hypothetical protein